MGSKKKASKPRKRSKGPLEMCRGKKMGYLAFSPYDLPPISHEVPEDHPEQKGSLTLAIGKRYYRRDGAISGPLEDVLTEPLYDFYDPEYAELYTSKARGYVAGSTGHHKADLVAECDAEAVDKDKGLDKLIKDISKAGSPVSMWGKGYGPPYVQSLTIFQEYRTETAAGCCSYNADKDLHSLVSAVITELLTAQKLFPPFNSLHEAMSVLREEVDELWEEVRKKQVLRAREEGSEGDKFVPNLERTRAARREAVQVIAMAMRLVLDNCTEGKPGYGK